MLKGQMVESLGIIDRGEYRGSTIILKPLADVLPDAYQHMGHTASTHPIELVAFEPDLIRCPAENVAFINLACKRYF